MKGKPDYELTESDELLVREAWAAYSSTTPAAKADPLALLQPKELNKLASALQLPRQVLAALRERRVIVASMSAKFLDSLAKELACSVSALIEILSSSTAAEPAGSHKSDVKPQVAEKVDFARVLQDAGVDSSRVADLVASGGDNGRN
jgi:DNA-binding Xre family transcriptional regulator